MKPLTAQAGLRLTVSMVHALGDLALVPLQQCGTDPKLWLGTRAHCRQTVKALVTRRLAIVFPAAGIAFTTEEGDRIAQQFAHRPKRKTK